MFDFPRMIKANLVSIIVVTVIFGLLGYAYNAMLKKPYYRSDASVVIKALSGEEDAAEYNNYLVANGLTKSLSIIAESDVVAKAVSEAIGESALTKEVISQMKRVQIIENSNVMLFDVVHQNADTAAKVANGYANVISKIGPDYVSNIEVVKLDSAIVASTPAGPNKKIGAIAGALLGLFLGLVLAYVKDINKYQQV